MSTLKDITTPLDPNKYYHIYNRGNAGQWIFSKENNYPYFLSKYKIYMLDYVNTYAYCLLPNHFHILIKVKSEEELIKAACKDFKKVSRSFLNHYVPSLSIKSSQDLQNDPDLLNFQNLVNLVYKNPDQFKTVLKNQENTTFRQHLLQWIVSERFRRFFLGYAKAFRSQEKTQGSLFQKLFRRKLIEDQSYLTQSVLYIHRNLIHHGYAVDLSDGGWTSFHSFLSDQATDLKRDEVLQWFGNREDFISIHEQYVDDWQDKQKWMIEDD